VPDPSRWTRAELAVLRRLDTPIRIQAFLDGLVYRAEDRAGCPRRVVEERRAHCYDGALLAAAALRRIGHPPLLLDLWAVRDDDHVLAVFRVGGCWGAVAKSNFVGLRYREPIHRTLRELALSYFEDYFSATGEKTLRAYSRVVDLRRFDPRRWQTSDEPIEDISDALDAAPHTPLLTPAQVRRLERVDARSLAAGMLGTRKEGLYRPDCAVRRGGRVTSAGAAALSSRSRSMV
jgi:hypothetical protein